MRVKLGQYTFEVTLKRYAGYVQPLFHRIGCDCRAYDHDAFADMMDAETFIDEYANVRVFGNRCKECGKRWAIHAKHKEGGYE